jgi:hypothetical protein
MTRTVAALYVAPTGPYPRMAGVECYDATRDARLYDGPHPVVAHPPCGPWGKLRQLYTGDQHDCAPRALEQVRAYGGVLEHPADSQLWRRCELPRPGRGDRYGGRTLEVEQVRFGHVARKRTWLYLVDVTHVPPMPPAREPTHWVGGSRVGSRPRHRRAGKGIPTGIKACSRPQRIHTPPAFAEWLVAMARSVSP